VYPLPLFCRSPILFSLREVGPFCPSSLLFLILLFFFFYYYGTRPFSPLLPPLGSLPIRESCTFLTRDILCGSFLSFFFYLLFPPPFSFFFFFFIFSCGEGGPSAHRDDLPSSFLLFLRTKCLRPPLFLSEPFPPPPL